MVTTGFQIGVSILDSVNEGLYVCDTDRRIVYWPLIKNLQADQRL